MPRCLKCGAELAVNEEGVAPVLCDRCAGVATGKARRSMSMGGLGTYPVTTLLLAINVIAYILQQIPGLYITGLGVNAGPLTLSGQYWRLFTAGFLHANIFHIGMNMWCLWSLGRLSERLFGKWQTFMIYMLTGVGGALLSIANKPDHAELGASGAVFGIVGAVIAGVRFGDLNISHGEKRAIFSSALSFAVLNFILGATLANVDNMCHLGGFITGLLVGLPLGAFARKNAALQMGTLLVTASVLFAGGRELVQTHGPAAARTMAGLAAQHGDFLAQADYLERYARSNPGDDRALIDLGEAYINAGLLQKAQDAFQRALTANPDSRLAKQYLQELKGNSPPEKR